MPTIRPSVLGGTVVVARIALLCSCVLVLALSRLEASEWKPFGLNGSTIRSLASAPGLVCAGTDGSGIFCRQRTGATPWTPIGPAGARVSWIWIDPVQPLHIFAADGFYPSNPSLWRTTNGGQVWTPVDNFPGGGRPWAVHGAPGGVPLFAAGAQVWVSLDLGNTWTARSTPGANDCLEVAPTDPEVVWSGGETVIFSGYTIRSLDGGGTWETVWDSHDIGDNQTADVAAHPTRHGVVLTGHEGFVLRSEDNGESFQEVLAAPSRFFLDWDGDNHDRAYAAGSPNGGTAHAFWSGDRGRTWTDFTGSVLAPRTVFRLEADDERLGVVYAATDDGVYRHYGGGTPLCLDTRNGMDALRLWKRACPPIAAGDDAEAPGPVILGDAIALTLDSIAEGTAQVDLGEVECLVNGEDVAFTTLDTPDPGLGRALVILARLLGAPDYGKSSSGLPRLPSSGDCP